MQRRTVRRQDQSFAKLLDRLTEDHARAVVFDIVFSDPGPDPAKDLLLAGAIRRNGKVILAGDLAPAPSGYGTPQRVATGLDPRRLAVLLAVLERRAGHNFGSLDVFVQVSAGVRLSEPGADLAVAAALVSSLTNRPTPADALFLGEIGLAGEVRPVGGVDRRLAEAGRLGFRRAFGSGRHTSASGISVVALDHVGELVRAFAA